MKRLLLGSLIVTVVLTACSANTETPTNSTTAITVNTCGKDITLPKPPTRVVMLSATAAATMGELGVLDKLVGRAGKIDTSIFSEPIRKQLEATKILDGGTTSTGGASVSTEAVLAERADLVVGYDVGVDREALAKAGIPLYTPDAFCPQGRDVPESSNTPAKKATFDLVDNEVRRIGTLFGMPDKADSVIRDMHERIDKLPVPPAAKETAAAYYVLPGQNTFSGYGPSSMVQTIFEQNGLDNVYAQHSTRIVKEVSMEAILQKNPDWILLLHGEGTSEQAMETFLGQKGAPELAAARNKRLIVLPFPLTDPPSPLSIEGAVRLGNELAKKRS